MFLYILWNAKLHLWDAIPRLCCYIAIYHLCHMKHHVVVCCILVVSMQKPVGRTVVNLHITHPQRAVNLHLSIEEVGTCIMIVQPRVNHLHDFPVGGDQFFQWKHLVFPAIVQQQLHRLITCFTETKVQKKMKIITNHSQIFDIFQTFIHHWSFFIV